MKTLSDAIIAGKAGDSERVILVRIIPESGDTWSELLWATRDITITDWEGGGVLKSFRGGMLLEGNLGTINQSVDIRQGGNVATVSSLTLTICNPEYNGEDRFDQNFTDNLENREVEICLVFWTGSNPAWSDILLFHKFVIEDMTYEYGVYEIRLSDEGVKRHKEIPDLILNINDYPAIPDYNKGKIAPLLYGQLWISSVAPWQGANNSIPVIRCDKNKESFIVSRNKIDSNASNVLLYFSDCNRWARLYGGTFVFTYARPSKMDFPLGVNILARFYSQLEKQGSQTNPTALDFKNAVDESSDSYFTLGASEKLYLKAPMPAEFGRIVGEATNIMLFIVFGTITGTGTVNYYNPEWDDGVGGLSTGVAIGSGNSGGVFWWPLGGDKSKHGKDPDQLDQNYAWTFDELAVIEMGLTMNVGSSAQIKNMWLEIDGLIVKSDKGIMKIPAKFRKTERRRGLSFGKPFDYLEDGDNVFFDAYDGAIFGSWIDADSRNNGYNVNNPIRRGCYLIESMLRDELGLISTEIDFASFDVMGNTTNGIRKDWYNIAYIDSGVNSLEFIAEFCQQNGIIYFQNYQNKEKVVALSKQTTVKTIDDTTQLEDEIKISLSDLSDFFNEFYINYDKSWVTNNYRKTLYLTASTNNLSSNSRGGTPNTYTGLCTDSQTKYNMTRRFTLDCDWINDAATAEYLIKWLAEWFCYRKYIVEMKFAGLDHIELELGDQIKINHELLPVGISNDDSFILFDISHDLENDKLTMKFMQIPDLLP